MSEDKKVSDREKAERDLRKHEQERDQALADKVEEQKNAAASMALAPGEIPSPADYQNVSLHAERPTGTSAFDKALNKLHDAFEELQKYGANINKPDMDDMLKTIQKSGPNEEGRKGGKEHKKAVDETHTAHKKSTDESKK